MAHALGSDRPAPRMAINHVAFEVRDDDEAIGLAIGLFTSQHPFIFGWEYVPEMTVSGGWGESHFFFTDASRTFRVQITRPMGYGDQRPATENHLGLTTTDLVGTIESISTWCDEHSTSFGIEDLEDPHKKFVLIGCLAFSIELIEVDGI